MAIPASGQAGTAILDGPPPSPQLQGAGPTGQMPFSMNGLAPPVPTAQVPPEILSGIQQLLSKIHDVYDSVANALQSMPDLAQKVAAAQNVNQQLMADLMTAGAQPTSPTATGAQFPGGGQDSGISGGGAI